MLVNRFPSGPYSTNAYVASCEVTKQAVLIDPSPGSFKKLRHYLQETQLHCISILLTHSHWDHIADVNRCKIEWNLPVFVHPFDAPNLLNPGSDGIPFSIQIDKIEPNGFLEDKQTINIGSFSLEVIHTPGHSAGCVCFYSAAHHILFSGDTVFKGAIGNTSFATSQPELMQNSLAILAKLPPDTIVYPGHGPSTSIRAEFKLT